MPHPAVARCYARFVLGLSLDDLPAPVVTRAALLALDILGGCLAASRQDFGRAVLRAAERRLLEERRDHPHEGPDCPMTREEMEGKFRGNAALAVSDERASRIVSDVTRLATLPRLTSLMEELR